MNRNKFIYGSMLMALVNIIVRAISFSYDVILSKLIGAEAMGLFQMTMSILMVFLMLATAGIPTAVSKLIARENSRRNYYAINKIFKISIILIMILSTILIIFLILFAEYITLKVFKNKDMLLNIYLLAPAIIVLSISGVLRGYFYGLKIMTIPSISQIIEHSTRFIIVLGCLHFVTGSLKPVYGAMIAIIGISVGELFDLIWSIIMKKKLNKRLKNNTFGRISTMTILSQLISMAIPLAFSGFFNVLLRLVNTILIPHKLIDAGYTNREAIATFGRIMGMAMPLIVLPFIVTSAIVINIIPSLSEDMNLKNYKNIKDNISLSIKITLLVTIPFTSLLIFFSKPIGLFLYNDQIVSQYIYILSYNTPLLALQHNFSGILNGLNKQLKSTINQLIGMIIQLSIIYILVGNPNFGINGYFIGFFLSTLIICILDLITLRKFINLKGKFIDIVAKPIIASILMMIFIHSSVTFLKNIFFNKTVIYILSLIIGGIFYLTSLIITKALPKTIFSKISWKK